MKTLFSMFAVIGTLLFMSCSKDDSPGSVQRPEFSDIETNDILPVSVKVINEYPEVEIGKVFINSNELGDAEHASGLMHTTALAGKNVVKVIASAPDGGSIVVTDSEGTSFCQTLGAGSGVEVSFEHIEVNAERGITVRFLSEACSGSQD